MPAPRRDPAARRRAAGPAPAARGDDAVAAGPAVGSSGSEKHRKEMMMTTPTAGPKTLGTAAGAEATGSMRALAWTLAVASVGCFAITDGDLSAQASSKIVARDQLAVVGGVLSLMWSGPLTVLAGMQRYGSYRFRMYQPLQGGSLFVMMQALGWTFYAISAGLCLVAALNPKVAEGTLMAVGALGFCANAMLNLSIDFFKPDRKSHIRKRINSLLGQRSTKGSAALILSSGTLLALCAMDMLVDENAPSRIAWVHLSLRASLAVFVLCALLTHVVSGAVDLAPRGYRLFQPFTGGVEFQVFQGIAWALLGANVYSCVHQDNFKLVRLQGGPSLYGAFGFTANVLLVTSIGYFKESSRRVETGDQTARSAPQFGPPWVLYASWILSAILATRFTPIPLPVVTTRAGFVGSAVLAAPLAHVGGWLKLRGPVGYRLFRPMYGTTSHILAQAFGWLLYALSLYVIIVTRGAKNDLFAPLAMLSHALIFESVRHYARRSGSGPAPATTSNASSTSDDDDAGNEENEVGEEGSALGFYVKIHMTDALALAAAVSSLALEIVFVDAWTWWAVHVGAGFVWAAARVALYLLAFGGNLASWRPFEGPDLWILCEAISWTLFVTSALGSAVILGLPVARQAVLAPSISAVNTARGWITATTVGYIFSHVLLRYGVLARVDEERAIASGRDRSDRRRRSTSMSILAAGSMPKSRGWSPWVVMCGALVDGLFFVWIDRASWTGPDGRTHLQQAFIVAVSMALAGVFACHLWVGPRTLPKYRFFQPFQGGSMFVLFQAISWTLFSVCLVLALVAANAGIEYMVSIPGTISLLGAGFTTAQLLLVWSLRFFTNLPKFSATIDGGVGLMLGLFSVALFMFVDFAVIRFALPYNFVRPVIASAWVAACASVPLSGFVMMKSNVRKSGVYSPTMVVLGCALWSFTILLGALLVINSVYNNSYIPAAWSATLAGITNLASHALLGLATVSTSSPRELLGSVPVVWVTTVVVFVFIRIFAYFILPTIRAFLDYPMHFYGMMAKRWEGWLSPDGLQALRNVQVQRAIPYGPSQRHVLDILRPLSMAQVHTKLEAGERLAPLVYLHGGGHIAVSSELLLHSMTPFTRAGLTVYAVEYPLSPDEQYPSAVLSALHALLWIQEFHCGNPACVYPCAGSDPLSSQLNSHECHFPTCGYQPPALDLDSLKPSRKERTCSRCGDRLGTTKVQLIGDSAGGSLVAMATALLCNEELYKKTVACVSPQYAAFKDLSPSSFPEIERVGILYGLLGRQTPIRDKIEGLSEDTYLWKLICHVAILLVFRLYDSGLNTPAQDAPGPRSSLTDIPPAELTNFAPETLLICGTSDPLYPCNVVANRYLNDLGHSTRLFSVPGTHAFHGFPVNWMRYIGVDWTTNALPATYELLEFFTGGKFDKEALVGKQSREVMVTDYSPLIVFPLLLVVFPAIAVTVMLRHVYKLTEGVPT